MGRLTRWGCEVWWVEPYPVRLPRTNDLNRLRQRYQFSHIHDTSGRQILPGRELHVAIVRLRNGAGD